MEHVRQALKHVTGAMKEHVMYLENSAQVRPRLDTVSEVSVR